MRLPFLILFAALAFAGCDGADDAGAGVQVIVPSDTTHARDAAMPRPAATPGSPRFKPRYDPTRPVFSRQPLDSAPPAHSAR